MTQSATQTRTVVVEREIPHPPEKIWRALTQQHLIEEWLKMSNDFKPELGHRFSLKGEWGGVEGEVLALEPNKSLSYRWDHPHEEAAYHLESVVTFTLTPTGAGTHVRMEQTGFRPEQKQAFGGAQYGWRQHLENLEKAVAQLD